MQRKKTSQINITLFCEALVEAFFKLLPFSQFRNPVLFIVYLSAIFNTLLTFFVPSSFTIHLSIWLWLTVLFANFATAIAERKGKAQAVSLRKMQTHTMAKKWVDKKTFPIFPFDLKKGDTILCEAGDIIPADGEIIEGIATVDESAITGESAPVVRESGGDRSAVTAGTRLIGNRVIIRVSAEKGQSFLDRMINLVEGVKKQKTATEITLRIFLSSFTIIYLLVAVSTLLFMNFSHQIGANLMIIPPFIALLVCLIPSTVSALLTTVGISGMDRLIQRNIIAKSGKPLEAAADIDLLILDKTGTITLGNRMAIEFLAYSGVNEKDFARVAQLASLYDETPEGRSIVVLAKNKFNLRGELLNHKNFIFVPFSFETRMSGLDILNEQGKTISIIRKGAVEAIQKHIESLNGFFPKEIYTLVEPIAKQGGTPLLVSEDNRVVGIVYLKDVIKRGLKERFDEMRKMGIKTLMVTGDNPLTAAAIAAEAGIDDYVAQATPEIKLALIREEQKKGYLIAMIGDGTSDAPALAQADVGVALNTGTQASREAGNMIDLDSNPTKLLDIVEIAKQLLMTKGALTTFGLANNMAKYLALIPAIALYIFPEQKHFLQFLNIMKLHSPESAILSTVIFNALIIITLLPLALKGIPYKPKPATKILRENLLIYGLGGIIFPFFVIKMIDSVLQWIKV